MKNFNFNFNFITLFNEGKDIDYWSPSSFHNGPPKKLLTEKNKQHFLEIK